MSQRSARAAFLRLSVAPVSSGLGAVVSLVILVVAMRDSQLASIGSYAAGLSAVAIAAVVAGGGTTLTFINGDVGVQTAVRSWRLRVVLPVLALVGAITVAILAVTTNLSWVDIAAGAGAGLVGNLAEIEQGYLRRKLRTLEIAACDLGSRVVGLVLILVDVRFAFVMMTVALLRFGSMWWLSRKDPSRIGVLRAERGLRRAIRPSLAGATILYAVIDRVPYLVAPLFLGVDTAGAFSALLSAQQAIAGALVSGLQTVMATRAEAREKHRGVVAFEALVLGLTVLGAAVGIVLTIPILTLFEVTNIAAAPWIWVSFCLVLPVAVANRAIQFRQIGTGQGRGVAIRLASGVAVGAAVLVIAGVTQSGELLATAVLAVECAIMMATAVVALTARLRNHRRADREGDE